MDSDTTLLEPRAIDILDRIRSVFVSRGFDGASMQDLARAAGMSAGNFYRYYPSKNAIVAAMVARDLEKVEAQFAAVMSSDNPRETLLETIVAHVRDDECPLWAEIEATAARRKDVAEIIGRIEVEIEGYLLRVFALMTGRSVAEIRRRCAAHAAAIIMLVKGAAMKATGSAQAMPPDPGSEFEELTVRLINTILDEVCANAGPAPGNAS